jgi:hypothetical protein
MKLSTIASGPDITAHGSLDLKQEIQIQIQTIANQQMTCKQHNYQNKIV